MLSNDERNHSIGAFHVGGWARSTFCDPRGGNCVEINGSMTGQVAVRDSKPNHPLVLVFGASTWCRFLAGVRDSDFDH